MNNLNSVLVEGVLTQDADFILSPKTGLPTVTFSLASNRFSNQRGEMRKEVNRFMVEASGNIAEVAREYGYHGQAVRVVGRLKEELGTDRDGRRQSRVIIVAEHIEFRPQFGKQNLQKEVIEAK